MDAAAWISLGSAIVSVLSLLATILFSSLASRSAARAHSTTVGAAETALRQALSTTRHRVADLAIQISTLVDGRRPDQLLAQDNRRYTSLQKVFCEAVEDNLNAYEDACGKYIDGKIDRDRFKKNFISEIQNLCIQKDNAISGFMHPEPTSKFQAIWRVYREWHIHEK